MWSLLRKTISNNKLLLQNFSYISAMQFFLLLAPLITFPYLVSVLGKDLYGVVLSAQMLASYASIVIDFGSNSVCAKHISICRNQKEKVSEIINSVLIVRLFLSFVCFFVYIGVVLIVPQYRDYLLLFVFTYGLTFNDLLFPQFFFQGIENMKMITIISIITKLVFIVLVFVVVKSPADYLFVPLLYSLGYIVGGIIALYIIYHSNNVRFFVPNYSIIKFYVKDCMPIFATDLICTVKDKINYILVGLFSGMNNVVIYDLALKLHSLLTKPLQILTIVLLPRFAVTRNVDKLKKVIVVSFTIAFILVIITNIFLDQIVIFFLHENVDLMPIRLFLIAPLLVSISSIISSNLFVAFGYNKYVLYSIIITTAVYVLTFLIQLLTDNLHSIYSFVALALVSYFTEFIYRIIKATKVIHQENLSTTRL